MAPADGRHRNLCNSCQPDLNVVLPKNQVLVAWPFWLWPVDLAHNEQAVSDVANPKPARSRPFAFRKQYNIRRHLLVLADAAANGRGMVLRHTDRLLCLQSDHVA